MVFVLCCRKSSQLLFFFISWSHGDWRPGAGGVSGGASRGEDGVGVQCAQTRVFWQWIFMLAEVWQMVVAGWMEFCARVRFNACVWVRDGDNFMWGGESPNVWLSELGRESAFLLAAAIQNWRPKSQYACLFLLFKTYTSCSNVLGLRPTPISHSEWTQRSHPLMGVASERAHETRRQWEARAVRSHRAIPPLIFTIFFISQISLSVHHPPPLTSHLVSREIFQMYFLTENHTLYVSSIAARSVACPNGCGLSGWPQQPRHCFKGSTVKHWGFHFPQDSLSSKMSSKINLWNL